MKRNNTTPSSTPSSSSSSPTNEPSNESEKEPLTGGVAGLGEEETGDTNNNNNNATEPTTNDDSNEKYKEYHPLLNLNNKLLCTIQTKYSYYQQKQMFKTLTTAALIFFSFYCGVLYDSKVIPVAVTSSSSSPVAVHGKTSNLRLGGGSGGDELGGGAEVAYPQYQQQSMGPINSLLQQQQQNPENPQEEGGPESLAEQPPPPPPQQQPNAEEAQYQLPGGAAVLQPEQQQQQQQQPMPMNPEQQQQQPPAPEQQQTGEMPVPPTHIVSFVQPDPNNGANAEQQQQQQQAMEEARAAAIAAEEAAVAQGEQVPVDPNNVEAQPFQPLPPDAQQPPPPPPPPQPQQQPPPPEPKEPTLPGTGNPDLSLLPLNNYKDIWDPTEPSDNAVFFHLPKAGGSTIKDIMGTCHRFVMATKFGVMDGHDQDTEIAIVYPANGSGEPGRTPFVNVDTISVAGIQRAKQMGFANSGLADATVITRLYESNDLFTPTARGRLFTVFRHPIDRTISMFYYIQVADWEPTYNPTLKDWTIEEYAQSDIIENNYYTRTLANVPSGELNDDHLKIAMEVVRRKLLVGLMDQMERTMDRIERFFKWTYHVMPENQEKCRMGLLSGGSNRNKDDDETGQEDQQQQQQQNKVIPKEGSEAYELLRWQNVYDLKLYAYIESIFEQQEVFLKNTPAGFRNMDATCCKCTPPTYPPEGFTCPVHHHADNGGVGGGEQEAAAAAAAAEVVQPPPPPPPEENGQNPAARL